MIQLSIDFINQKSNYNVVLSPYGELDFITDYGVKYTISFVTEEYVGGCETYQFVIKRKKPDKRLPHDPKVEQTILTIIQEFFAENLNVLLYICDDSDGKEASRHRLFLNWFQKNADPERFTIRTAHATVENKGFYAAIIVENRNPLLKNIIEDFETTAQALTEGKP